MNLRPLFATAAILLLVGCAAPQARLGGRVMFAGEPVEKAQVELRDETGDTVATAFTDEDGVYDLYPAPVGSFRVTR